jgi:transposase-like protein
MQYLKRFIGKNGLNTEVAFEGSRFKCYHCRKELSSKQIEEALYKKYKVSQKDYALYYGSGIYSSTDGGPIDHMTVILCDLLEEKREKRKAGLLKEDIELVDSYYDAYA